MPLRRAGGLRRGGRAHAVWGGRRPVRHSHLQRLHRPWQAAHLASGPSPAPPANLSACVRLMGLDACQLPEGLWLLCPPPPRSTLSGRQCDVPFALGGLLRTDCVLPAPGSNATAAYFSSAASTSGAAPSPAVSSGREVCAVAGSLAECLPSYNPPPSLQPRYGAKGPAAGSRG
jgi:hypothetical protein